MHDRLIRAYHRLPAPARSAAASLRGYYLRSWRYGPETDALACEALGRERWSDAQWRRWREERLGRMLESAATRVPFYRAHWARRRAAGDRASWELLENWPVLRKADLRAAPEAFVADSLDRRRLFREQTSGTTGTPVTLWFDRETVRGWYALCEARLRLWNGVDRHRRWAMIGGQLVAPVARTRPPFWVWNRGLDQLYLSSYHLSAANAPAYVRAIARYGARYVVGYASSLSSLAQYALDLGLEPPRLDVAVSNAEPLLDHQRAAIGRAFGCAVRDTYGMCEICCAASECESGALHLWPEAGELEVLDDDGDGAVPAGATGRFVCTGLLNEAMPLVRYEVGDRGALAAGAGCDCGRTLPVLASVEGRSDDVLVTRDGRRVGRLDPVFKADLPILEAQIVQETRERVRARIVPAAGYGPEHRDAIARGLRARLGDVDVVEEIVDRIPRGSNGKFRAVVSEVSRTGGAAQ